MQWIEFWHIFPDLESGLKIQTYTNFSINYSKTNFDDIGMRKRLFLLTMTLGKLNYEVSLPSVIVTKNSAF